jgi:VCBS repeat-containing protein
VGPAHGTLTLNGDGTFTYTPAANYKGADSFTYKVNDGTADSNIVTVTLNVTPVNDAPVAGNVLTTTAEDTPLTGTLTASDVDGDALVFSKASNPAHGTVTISAAGVYIYTPASNYVGGDSFTYTASDGHGGTATRTVSIDVTAVNDAPVIGVIVPPVSQDGSHVSLHVAAFVSDTDGDGLTFSATGLPPGVSIDPHTGLISGLLPKDASQGGPYTVTLMVDDGRGGTVTQTFIWPVFNPAPRAADDTASVRAGGDVTVGVLANDSDPDGDPLTVTQANAGHGSVVILPDGSIKYTPLAGFIGTDRITYVISDGNGGFAIASITVAVGDSGYTEKPPVFGFNGPETASRDVVAPRLDLYPGITAEGAVVEAVFDIGELRSIAGRLGIDGAVLAAANGVKSLNGVAGIGTNGVIVETIRAERARSILLTAGFERGFQEYRLDGLPGFSLRHNVPGNLGGLSVREQVVIESLVRDDTLIIQISNTLQSGTRRIVEYRVMQPDGRAIPEWLNRAGRDLLIGRRAANLDTLLLRVEAVYSDGSIAIEEVKIDTATGEIQPAKPGRQGAMQPRLFGQQFDAPAMLSTDQIDILGRALAR